MIKKDFVAARKQFRRAQKDDAVSRERVIREFLRTEIIERQEEIGMGNLLLAEAVGCKWDTIDNFRKGKNVSAVRFFYMVEVLGGQIKIEWDELEKS